MSIYTIQITEPAENDLRDISHYISHELLEPQIANCKNYCRNHFKRKTSI